MRQKTQDETTRSMLDATAGINEALYGQGVMTDEEAAESNARRAAAGARPLAIRPFGAATLPPAEPLDADAIRSLRERTGASQAVLASYLGVATNTLSQWERGLRRPDGPALRLLSLIERHGLEYVR